MRCWVHLLGQVVGLLLAHCSNFVGLLHGIHDQGLLEFLDLACSADLFRAVLVDSWLMTHLTASDGYRSGVCRSTTAAASGRGRVCLWVGVGVCCRCYTGSRSENLIEPLLAV